MLNPDVFAEIYFYQSEESGRKLPTPSNFFSCIFVLQENFYDCRLLLEKIGAIYPGDTKKDVPIKFLSPELVLPKLRIGQKFYLREINYIGAGEITKITYDW